MILEMTRPVQGGLRQERKLEVTSNHLANVDTAGFKKDVVSFDRFFKAELNTDLTQGDVRRTGNDLDLALADEGFFKIDTPFGVRYSRNGNFTLNNNNVLVNQSGDPVLGQAGPLTVNGEKIEINAKGEVYVDGDMVDTLDVVTFDNLLNLQKQGSGNFLYKGDPADEKAPDNILVEQRALEGSNVKTVDEMVHMIDHNRMYEVFQKMMLTFDEVDGKAINDVGKLQ
ncbi:MAG: flagellar hook-basal body complex protein [Thermodesulfobacteriota bacterium]|nr:flagellar hook-basal body complex protein [Thermodesulfobacteriota bacterium]